MKKQRQKERVSPGKGKTQSLSKEHYKYGKDSDSRQGGFWMDFLGVGLVTWIPFSGVLELAVELVKWIF